MRWSPNRAGKPEAGLKQLQQGAPRHKLSAFVEVTLNERTLALHINEVAKEEAALLDGCYCIESEVPEAHPRHPAIRLFSA